MPLEPLELGYLLMSERPRLVALSGDMARTPEAADAAVRRSLRSIWLARSRRCAVPICCRRWSS